jgi:hypothetical protein
MVGERVFAINPIYAIPAAIFHIVSLWNRCQSGMGGLAQLPDAGGLNNQAAWLVEAFAILDRAADEQRKRET